MSRRAEEDDAGLPPFPALPRLADPIGPLSPDGPPTPHAAPPPRSEPRVPAAAKTVAGQRAFVVGAGAAGELEAWIHPYRVAAGLRVRGSEIVGVRESASGLERSLRVAGAEIVERVVVPPDAACVVLEWAAGDDAVELELTWRTDLRGPPEDADAPPAAAAPRVRHRAEGRALLVRGGEGGVDDGGGAALFVLNVAPDGWSVEPDAGGGVAVRAGLRLPAGGTARLALLGGSAGSGSEAFERASRAAGRARLLARSRAGEAERLRSERLALDAPDPSVGEALERAKARLGSYRAAAPGVGRSLVAGYGPLTDGRWCTEFRTADAVRGALAALATGDTTLPRDVVTFLAAHQDPAGRLPGSCTTSGVVRHEDAAAPLFLLLVARYAAWTGDVRTVRSWWPGVRAAYGRRATTGDGPGWTEALAALLPAAESIGETELAAALKASGGGEPGPSSDPAAVSERGGPRPCPDRLSDAAETILDVADRLLGIEPDAPRGRLVLRPRPPRDWDRFTARSIPLGGAAVSLGYRREAALHRFEIRQDRGAAPVQLVLEPEVPDRPGAARVDGTAADLDPAEVGGRWRVPVQLVLDHPRTLEIERAPS